MILKIWCAVTKRGLTERLRAIRLISVTPPAAKHMSKTSSSSSIQIAKINEQKKIKKELAIISNTLKLSKSLKSNKQNSYRVLAQVAMSVPKRIKFASVEYNGKNKVIIKGQAATDQDILKLINNLGMQELVLQASLGKMNYKGKAGDSADIKKNFTVFVDVKG